jgi:predicted unusual protein kinase regulating ubiquinone biosynthesis (AarF/ABC1/UbiB family)
VIRQFNNLKEFPHILVPLPVLDYSSRSVLTMDYVSGTKITALIRNWKLTSKPPTRINY